MADNVGVYQVTGGVILPADVAPAPTALPSGGISGVLENDLTRPVPDFNLARELPQSSYTYDVSGNVVPLQSSSGWGYGDWSGSLTSYTYVSGSGGLSAQGITGSGYGDVFGEFSSSQPEVSRLNAFFSGTATLDPAAGSPSTYPLYYSKGTRLQTLTATLRPTIADVFNNVPDYAPSRSFQVAPLNPSGAQVSGYLAQFGVTTGSPPPGEIFVGNWTTYLNQNGTIDASLFPNQAYLALSANLVQVSGKWAAVTNSFFIGGIYSTVILSIAGDGHGGYLTQSGFSAGTPGQAVKILSWQELSSSFSGVFCNKTVYEPVSFSVPITASGRLRDLRVRVEALHSQRSATNDSDAGLQSLALSLRSPNTNFRSAHPLWNSPLAGNFPITTNAAVLAQIGTYGDKYAGVPALLRNSYLLWSGQNTEDGLKDALNAASLSASYHTFDRDIDMRTIFWDAASVNNPREITALFPNTSDTSPGTALSYQTLVVSSSYRQFYQSPTYGVADAGYLNGAGASWTTFLTNLGTGSLTCSVIPWFLDDRQSGSCPPGALAGVSYTFNSSSVTAALPPLWRPPAYSGSYGPSLGPQTIRPVYPILDDVYVQKLVDAPNSSTFLIGANHPVIQGLRPGLRDTEISGAWTFQVGVKAAPYSNGYFATGFHGVWLRQARLEAIYDSGIGAETFNPATIRKYTRGANVKTDGYQLFSVESGSCAWDVGTNYVQEFNAPEYGRTVLITDASQSNPDSYAVLTFITGSLWNDLSASGIVSTTTPNPSWFLGYTDSLAARPSNIPYIPDSSMSFGLPRLSASDIDVLANSELLLAALGTSSIPPANDIVAFLKRQGYSETQADAYAAAVSAAYAAATATNYFGP